MKKTKITYLALLAVLLSPFAAQLASADTIDYSCDDCPIPIGPNPETITSTITVADIGTITDLFIDITAFHTWNGDLIISLAHGAISTVLFDGSGPDDYFGGSYEVSAFVGAELSGDWTLTMQDIFFGDAGDLTDWSMRGNYQASAVPEPGTLALLGLGLVGMAARRRKA